DNLIFRNFFSSTQLKYQKVYSNRNEELYRRKVFFENLKAICEHNEKFRKNLETYEKGVNVFADMDFDEFRSTHLGFNPKMVKLSKFHKFPIENLSRRQSDIPTEINWFEKGAVSRVRRQGNNYFPAIGSVESQLYRKYNVLVELSVQEIVDCSTKNGNEGCVSGVMSQSFDYMIENGIGSETNYPYTGTNETCLSTRKRILNIKGYVQLPSGDENTLLKAVAKIGPIAAAMEITNNTRQFVGKTIFYDKACHRSSDFMNHAVLIVGYGSSNGSEYWLIKNSWGDSFGDGGFAKIARNKGNHCNIATDVSFPIL
ncbi:Cathepsin L, partial [Pseudolycoriella hygida]